MLNQQFLKVRYTHTHTFNSPFSRTTQVSRYQKGKTNLDFTEARDSEWQWHQLDRVQVCISLQTDNHASTPPLSFLQAATLPATQPTASKHGSHRASHQTVHIVFLTNDRCLRDYDLVVAHC